MFRGWFRSISGLLVVLVLANVPVWAQTLEGWAVLPADTFAPGPLSAIRPPFPSSTLLVKDGLRELLQPEAIFRIRRCGTAERCFLR